MTNKKGYTGTLRRPCDDCDQMHYSTKKNGKYCNDCLKERSRLTHIKIKLARIKHAP